MWECGICSKILWKSSGIHRMIRTASGRYRLVGLCPHCAYEVDHQKKQDSYLKSAALFFGVAMAVGAICMVLMGHV